MKTNFFYTYRLFMDQAFTRYDRWLNRYFNNSNIERISSFILRDLVITGLFITGMVMAIITKNPEYLFVLGGFSVGAFSAIHLRPYKPSAVDIAKEKLRERREVWDKYMQAIENDERKPELLHRLLIDDHYVAPQIIPPPPPSNQDDAV